MDKTVRNTLRNTVTQCRRILERAIAETLEGRHGILPNGTIEPAGQLTHLTDEDRGFRENLAARLEHIQATMLGGGKIGKGAVEQLVREVGFTHLNRFCAFKLLSTLP